MICTSTGHGSEKNSLNGANLTADISLSSSGITSSTGHLFVAMPEHSSSSAQAAVSVNTSEPDLFPVLRQKAEDLAELLQVKIVSVSECHNYNPLLLYTEKGLQIQLKHDSSTQDTATLSVNFLSEAISYRRQHGGGIKQALARAVGIKPGFRPTVIDATAGLGRDSFLLASLGSRVTMIERSPLLAALLGDGIARAIHARSLPFPVKEMLSLLQGNAATLMQNIPTAHTIYLDPMYPHSRKSALNKLEMRLIRTLVGDDTDAEDLFSVALNHALNRVVVKRPKTAPLLSSFPPSHVIKMKNSRFDVYMT